MSDINTSLAPEHTVKQASSRNALILGLFALISTGLIAITHYVTKDIISVEIEKSMARRLNQLISADKYNNDVYKDCLQVNAPEFLGNSISKIYRMRNDDGNFAVFISSVAPDGYAGNINLVTGIFEDGTLAGVRVTEHKETPGLGDKIEIEKSDWIRQFENRSLKNLSLENWAVKKDGGSFDALTGATITPRAIVKAVNKTLIYFQQHQSDLFIAESNCGVKK